MKNLKARCATLALFLFSLCNLNQANAQAYDPADMAISQAASLKALKLVENLTASLAVNSPAQSNVSSCERKLQETVTCTSSGCDQRPAIDYCGRALARAASVDRDPRIGQVLSAFRSFKADLADIKATVHTIDDTTGRIEAKGDENGRKLDDLKVQMTQLMAKAQMRGVCGELVEQISKLQETAQAAMANSLSGCIANSVPNSTKLGLAAIDEGVGLIATPNYVIVDPTQGSSSSHHGVLPWILMPLSGCAVGGLTGYALAEGDTVDFGGQRHDNGDEGKGIALGCAVGGLTGAVGALIYNSATRHGD